MTTNHYLDISLPLLLRCKDFLMAERGRNEAVDFRELISNEFITLEKSANIIQLDAQLVIQLKYILSAFIDEVVMHSAWPERLRWMRRSLQLQFFGEHIAGEGFFDRLNQIRQNGLAQIDLLEVCYWCLQLGFQGKYRFNDPTHLTALQAGVMSQIEITRGRIDKQLAPAGLPANSIVKHSSKHIPFWVIGVVTIAVIYFVYFAYSMVIDAQARAVLQQIQHAFISFQDRQ